MTRVKREPCPDVDALARYLVEAGTAEETAHLKQCKSCQHIIDLVRRAADAGVRSSDILAATDEVDSLQATLLALPMRERLVAAATEPFARPALGKRFSDLATHFWERDLALALDHIDVAVAIYDEICAQKAYIAELRFEAWKNKSTIHRERGEYDSARAALVRAAEYAEDCTDTRHKNAVVNLADALICALRDVWEPRQALAALDLCEPVFEEKLDHARSRAALTSRGMIFLAEERYEEALITFLRVVDSSSPDDESAYADALRNAAIPLVRLHRLDAAADMIAKARRIDETKGRTAQLLRDVWITAAIEDSHGHHASAAASYLEARRGFNASGDHEAALLSGKDAAVALVGAGRLREALALLRELIGEAGRNTDRRRFTADALAYLRDLAAQERIALDCATEISRYIDRIHVQRPRAFQPPPESYTM